MKDNVLILLFVGIPFCVVLAKTAAVDSYWTDRWEERDAGPAEKQWKEPTGPDRFEAITLKGQALDDKTTGSIVVKAVFAGPKIPLQTPIDMSAFGRCTNTRAEYPKQREVNMADKSVPWAFVYVKKSGLPSGLAYGAVRPRMLVQKGCVYRPHVLGLVAGQSVWVYNLEDEEAHNIKISALGFNAGQKAQGKEIPLDELDAQMGLQLKCEIHSWMQAKINVMDHPYFCTTVNEYEKKDGVETDKLTSCEGLIKRLPPGKYTLAVWHETFSGTEVTVEVKAGEATTVTIELK